MPTDQARAGPDAVTSSNTNAHARSWGRVLNGIGDEIAEGADQFGLRTAQIAHAVGLDEAFTVLSQVHHPVVPNQRDRDMAAGEQPLAGQQDLVERGPHRRRTADSVDINDLVIRDLILVRDDPWRGVVTGTDQFGRPIGGDPLAAE